MKKIYSLIKACMTSDMNLFKIKTKKNSKLSNTLIPLLIAFYLMFMIWGYANSLFEKLSPINLQFVILPLAVFSVSIMTIIEGIYKTGALLFNCKDDNLLLSLPIRIFKFYIFELIFNSLFILPIMIAYIRWAEYLNWTYFLTSFIMLIILPVIPIIISCIIGVITSSLVSRFKYKNVAQIVITMFFLLVILLISYSMDNIFNYLIENATSINDLITKIYYPAGVYAKLITNFNIFDLVLFILINISIFVISILVLEKFYYSLNSRLKKITTIKKVKVDNLTIKSNYKIISLIKKELNTFFKTPVFIINAGFALVLFIFAIIFILLKFNNIILILTDPNGLNLSEDLIVNNTSILILILIIITSYMTSITNSVISLEGKNINILKSLPINTKTILMSKIYSSLILTTPILLIGTIILFIKFKINILELFLLIFLVVLVPLVSHFIGLIINLKYPKLDAENETQVVKQSMSSFLSVMIGMMLLVLNIVILTKIIGVVNSTLILILSILIYLLIDIILYLYLIYKGVEKFNKLSI